MVNDDGDRGATNWELLGEIQAEGLRAAGALVERLVHLVDGSQTTRDSAAPDGASPHGDSEDPAPPSAGHDDTSAIRPWFDLWRDLFERTSETVRRIQTGVDGGLAPTLSLTVVVGPDGRGQTEMWLHNGTPGDHGELVPQCGPLTDAYGNVLECDAEFDPPKIDGLPSRSSRGFVVSIRPDPAPPGSYRGVVQMRGAEPVWMPIEVIVSAAPS